MKKATKTNGLTFLSIDPGCRHTGWSFNVVTPSGKLRVVSHGVFEHNYSPEDNAKFVKSIVRPGIVVLIEEPPIIRVNASTSHVLAKIFGAILGIVSVSDIMSYEKIPPKSWQHSLLRESFEAAKREKRKIIPKEKDALLKAVVNQNITRNKEIVSPHVIDTIGMVLFYRKRNGANMEDVQLKEVLMASSKKKRARRRTNVS